MTIGEPIPGNATPEQREKMVAAMKRIFSGERLTYTDKEMELVMLGWKAELEANERNLCQLTDDLAESRREVAQLQEQNQWLDAKLAQQERDTADGFAIAHLNGHDQAKRKYEAVMRQALEALRALRYRSIGPDLPDEAIKALEDALK